MGISSLLFATAIGKFKLLSKHEKNSIPMPCPFHVTSIIPVEKALDEAMGIICVSSTRLMIRV